MADKAKLLKIAQKHLSKGSVDKAITTFQELVALDPRDQRLLLRLAELQARVGRKKEAIQSYEKIAGVYIAQDFTPKAIAVYKTILRLDPELIPAYEKLADLYKSQGLEAEALSQLENLFNFLGNKHEEARQIEVLKLMADMDPENLGFQVRLGEMLAKKGMKNEAAEAFAKAGATLSRRGFHDRASHLFEKIIGLNPQNTAVRKELCAHYLESGQYAGAQKEVEAILEREPDDPRMVLLLGRILFQQGKKGEGEKRIAQAIRLFKDAGDLESVMKEFLFVAQTHLNNGEFDEAEIFYRRIRESSPHEDRVVRGLIRVAEKRKDRASRIDNLGLLARILKEKGDNAGARKAYEELYQLDRLNQEARDFIEKHPQDVDAPAGPDEKITKKEQIDGVQLMPREFLEEEGAGEVEEEAAGLAEPDEEEIEELEDLEVVSEEEEDLAGDLDGGESEFPDIVLDEFSGDAEALQQQEDAFAAELPEPDEDVLSGELIDEGEASAEDLLAEAEVYRRYGLEDKFSSTLDRLRSLFPDDPAVVEKIRALEEGGVEPGEEVEPSSPPGGSPQPSGEAPLEENVSLSEKPPGTPPAGGEEAPEGPDQFSEELEEAEFYLSQGLDEEAGRIYRQILARSPGYPGAAAALSTLESGKSTPPRGKPGKSAPGAADRGPDGQVRGRLVVEDAVPEDAGGFLDIAEELRAELSNEFEASPKPAHEAAPVTFEEVFVQFKKGIEEVLGEEEYETHYNLGIAYKDMGLFDDALREFEVASHEPGLTQDSLSLMAMCFQEKKDYDSAIKVVEKALETASEASRAGLYYQLGEAQEKKKEFTKALAAFSEVKARDPLFEGIEGIIKRVRSQASREVPGEPDSGDSLEAGMDEMLTDLIREVEEMAKESSGKKKDEPGRETPRRDPKDRISYL